MDFLSVVLIGVGLAMDACAVSIAKGMVLDREHIKEYAWKLAVAFGLFQGMMPLIGYFSGARFSSLIQNVDHWIAFILLSAIGIHMVKESVEQKEEANEIASISWSVILVLAIATSIDALAVGISFAFLKVSIFPACGLIAGITFTISFAAVLLGKKLGTLFEAYAERCGGIILILIGLRILIEHLFFNG
ncbi:MAG: manganese efflux pump [Erysipelotrichaceae bacterium]|nr:manganese efflux pump [Erysipelotrichaceae bacterium]